MSILSRSKARPSSERLGQIRRSVGRWTTLAGEIDWSRLSDSELGEASELLARLQERAAERDHEDADDPAYLGDKDRRRYRALVARAIDRPDDFFERVEREATMKAKAVELAQRVARAPARPRFEEQGAVLLRREWVFDFLRDGVLYLEHLALLAAVLGQLEAGVAFAPRARVENGVLVFSGAYGPIGADRTGMVWDWKPLLRHLATNGLLVIDAEGSEWRVRRGARVVKVIEGRSA